MLEKGFSIPELAEPILPEPPSWLPLPAGWLVMGGVLLIALLVFALSVWPAGDGICGGVRHWRQSRNPTPWTAGLF